MSRLVLVPLDGSGFAEAALPAALTRPFWYAARWRPEPTLEPPWEGHDDYSR